MHTIDPASSASENGPYVDIAWYGDFSLGYRQHLEFEFFLPASYSCLQATAWPDNELATEEWRSPLMLRCAGQGRYSAAKGLQLVSNGRDLQPGFYSLEIGVVAAPSAASSPAYYYARLPFCVVSRVREGKLEIVVDGSVANIGHLPSLIHSKQEVVLQVKNSVLKSSGDAASYQTMPSGNTDSRVSPTTGTSIPNQRFRLPLHPCKSAIFETLKCRASGTVSSANQPSQSRTSQSRTVQSPLLKLGLGRNTLHLRRASELLNDHDLTRVREIVSDSDCRSLGISLPMLLQDFGELRLFGRVLTILDLRESRITDATLTQIAHLPNLTTLDLSGTQVTPAGLRQLRGLPNLFELRAEATQLGKGIADTLRGMSKLEIVVLNSTNIDDEELIELTDIKQIRRIAVRHCFWLSKDGIAAARCRRSELKIED